MMRYLFLLGLFVAAGCSSSKTDDAAKKAGDAVKAAGASAASAAAKSVASAAKKAAESKAPAAPAAGGDNAALVAVWKADVESITKTMMDDPKMKAMPEEQRKQAIEMGKKMLANMTMEFTKDGKMVMSMGPQMRQEGTYVVKSMSGKDVVIEGTMQGKTQTLNAVLDGNKLTMKIDGREMAFTK